MVNLKTKHNNSLLGIGKTQMGAIALAAMALVLPACSGTEEVGEVGENVTTEEVANETEAVIGQTVTIRNTVGEQVDEFAFTMTSDEFFGGEEILVINASGEPTPLPEQMALQVTGEVAQFVLADIEAEYGLELEDELYVDYETKPAIIAQSIALAPDPETVLSQPDIFLNQTVAVEGEVENIVSPAAFVLNDDEVVGGEGLLVLNVTPEPILREDAYDNQQVVVTGEIRNFVIADVEREYNYTFTNDIRTQIEAEYTYKPVVIAKNVYPSAVEN